MRKLVFSLALAALLFVGVGLTSGGGVAFAHSDSNPAFGDTVADAPHPAPVGQNAFNPDFPGQFNGFVGINPDTKGNALAGITHNPNCPAHYANH